MTTWTASWKRRVSGWWPPKPFVIAVVLAFVAAMLLTYFAVRPAETMTVLEAKTGRVEFHVRNPAMAAFVTRCLSIREKRGAVFSTREIDGIFTPSDGSVVSYTVVRPEEVFGDPAAVDNPGEGKAATPPKTPPQWTFGISIQVMPPPNAGDSRESAGPGNSVKPIGGGPPIALADTLFFNPVENCETKTMPPLPLWGGIEVGEEPSAATGNHVARYMREGRLNIYAKAQTIGPLKQILGFKPSLYQVDQGIALPYGTRLSDGGGMQAPWHGTVELDETGLLSVNAMTRAKDIRIYFPGAIRVPESIELGGLSQYMRDPNVQVLQIYVGSLVFVIAVFGLFLQGLQNGSNRKSGSSK